MTLSRNNRLIVLAANIRTAHAGIERDAASMAQHALVAGNALLEAKATIPHGEWTGWLLEHAGLSPRTARRYMQLAASGLETATVAVLRIRGAAEVIAKHDRRNKQRLVLLDECQTAADRLLKDLQDLGPTTDMDSALAEIDGRTLSAADHDTIVRNHLSAERISKLAAWTHRWEREVSPLVFEYERRFGWTSV